MTKQEIIAALRTFINQRPGLEYGNYGDPVSYRAEVRSIGKDLAHARELLRFVELRDSITADAIIKASEGAFSGRLTIAEKNGKVAIDYCTGQYWPTEYRRAVCAVMASAIWSWMRDECMPAPDKETMADEPKTYRGARAGDFLRHAARREFGRGIAARWFN